MFGFRGSCLISSFNDSMNPCTACFVPLYAAKFRVGISPAAEHTVTMWPSLSSIIRGKISRKIQKCARTLISKDFSNSSGLFCRNGLQGIIPALFIIICMSPTSFRAYSIENERSFLHFSQFRNRSINPRQGLTLSIAVLTSHLWDTSTWYENAFTPVRAVRSLTNLSLLCLSTSQHIKIAPAAASWLHIWRPIPPAEPVIC